MIDRNRAVLSALFGEHFLRDFNVRFWDGTVLPSTTLQRRFTLVVNSPAALREAFSPPVDLHAGIAFVGGGLDVEGDLPSAILALERATAHRSPLELARIAWLLRRLPSFDKLGMTGGDGAARNGARLSGTVHSIERDRAAISYHYDHPVAFYKSFLDRDLVYSCAYFDDGIEDLDAAQSAKLDYVLRKLRLQPGMHFLDIGCGWGSLVLRAARMGAQSLGITLSRVQCDEANRRIEAAGLKGRARVELCDYRELGNRTFDRIASIGMFEHVGRSRTRDYFRAAYRALRPGGLFMNHSIAEQTPGRTGGRARGFVNRYVFPDGELVAVADGLGVAERVGFEVRDVENLREHYARTLTAWVTNIERNVDAAVAAAGRAAFRVWRLYMASSSVAFRTASLGVYQSLLARPDTAGRVAIPPTRRDLYDGAFERPRGASLSTYRSRPT
jgi:cyclopropane-fatty-acyl-phospholipid synthase